MLISIYILTVAAFLFLIRVIIIRYKRHKIRVKMDYTLEGQNIALSMTRCKSLHKELAKKIHPDKVDDILKDEAEKLMKEINACRYSYQDLSLLKNKVENIINK